MTPPPEASWQDLPASRQEEVLRLLGRMLADRLAARDADEGVTHDGH